MKLIFLNPFVDMNFAVDGLKLYKIGMKADKLPTRSIGITGINIKPRCCNE